MVVILYNYKIKTEGRKEMTITEKKLTVELECAEEYANSVRNAALIARDAAKAEEMRIAIYHITVAQSIVSKLTKKI